MRPCSPSSGARQSGFGLVEIMVAMVVGLIVLAGVIEIFVGSRQSYRLASGQARVQENGRFALAFLGQGVRLAGYPTDDTSISAIYSPGTLTTEGGGGASDTVTVLYQSATDCLGNGTPTYANGTNYAKDRYWTDGADLRCTTYDEADGQRDNQVLVEGVDNMQVLYGIDDDADDVANRYLNASQVGSWSDVVSIRIELLVNSVDDALSSNDTTSTYALLDASTLGPYNDLMVRRVFGSTYILRNRLQ